MPEYVDKIYIIGPISEAKRIKDWADYYSSLGRYDVRYVEEEPEKNFPQLVAECFRNIVWSDRVYVIPKPDGTIGEGVVYEMALARMLGKRVEKFYGEEQLDKIWGKSDDNKSDDK